MGLLGAVCREVDRGRSVGVVDSGVGVVDCGVGVVDGGMGVVNGGVGVVYWGLERGGGTYGGNGSSCGGELD